MNNNPHLLAASIEGGLALAIFERFEIDHSLPKHALRVVPVKSVNFVTWASSTTTPTIWVGNQILSGRNLDGPRGPGLFSRIWSAIRNKADAVYTKVATVPVQQIFEAIQGQGRKLEILNDRLEAHKEAIAQARSMGQVALAENLEKRTHMAEMEAVLFASGFVEFIEEKTMIDFAQRCERGLKLDWIKNFSRMIPHDVRIKKTQMDALNVFDAYVILHYDPNNTGAALTKKEIEKKKDPILFGLIENSRRLYCVGSWKDEFCTLTFGELLDRYGKEALTLK